MDDKRKEKIDRIVSALVAGAHSLYKDPVTISALMERKMVRLPMLSYVNSSKGRYFILSLLATHYGANMADVAHAIKEIATRQPPLAFIDATAIDPKDLAGVQTLLETAFLKRGDGGAANANIESFAKLYIRDVKQAKPKPKSATRKPIICPDWLLAEPGTAAEKRAEELDDTELEPAPTVDESKALLAK